MKKYILLPFFILTLFPLFSQSIALTEIAGPFPWLLGFEMPTHENRFYTIRQNGFIVIVDQAGQMGGGTSDELIFLDISNKINLEAEQGLLGLAFHPNYASNGFFYVYYNAADTQKSTLSRFSRSADNPDMADPNSEVILLSYDQPTVKHNGGCLAFGHDGYLYIASGDGGDLNDPQNQGQKINTFLGKLLRIDVDNGDPYAIPSDNPFADSFGYYPEIWATGLRNPWRFSFDRMTGDLWISDVGQEVWEEIMFQPQGDTGGQNYGWSCREGTDDFNSFGCTNPVGFTNPNYQYAHNDNPDCSGSITGGFVYRGMQNGDLFGKYIYTDFCTGIFTALTRNGLEMTAEHLGDFNPFDYISFSQNEYGELFVMSYFSGRIFKIESLDCTPVAAILPPNQTIGCLGDTLILNAYTTGDTSYTFQWQRNGNDLIGGQNQTLEVTQTGDYQLITTNVLNGCTAISEVVGIEFTSFSPATINEEICDGDNYDFNGMSFSETGIFEFNFLSQNDCDSVVFLNLNVLPNTDTLLEIAIEINTYFEDILIENDTTIFQQFVAENGCDSLVTLQFSTFTNTVNQLESLATISLHPNPVADYFFLEMHNQFNTNLDYEIYNSFGKKVTHQFSFNSLNNYFKRENAPIGIYFLVIKKDNHQTNLKFICF